MIGAFICLFVAIAAIITALVFKPKRVANKSPKLTYGQMIADRQKLFGGSASNRRRNSKPQHNSRQAPRNNPQSTVLITNMTTLTRLVNGQTDVARRLIEGNLKKYPDKSPDWACEKAITDIERDRRVN